MPRYEVQHNYRSVRDGKSIGPWVKGEQIELDDDVAAFVNVDSPGALADLDAPTARAPRGGRSK